MNLNSEQAMALFKERVEPKLIFIEDCWETSYIPKNNGYVSIHVRPFSYYLHRLVYVAFNGNIPENHDIIMHKCDNRKCCNPDHLISGTADDNIKDMDEKGRRKVWHPNGELNPSAKLTREQVDEILNSNLMQKDLAKKFNVSKQLISEIKRKNVWA